MKLNRSLLVIKQIGLILLLDSLIVCQAVAESTVQPTISIIIDDLGYRFQADIKALTLPGPVAYAILPHGPHTEKISELAFNKGKHVLLHQPMQAMNKNQYPGPGALTLDMTREEFISTVTINMDAVPNLIGINNHMGSLLTRDPHRMQWLMELLRKNGQFYVDSLTSRDSIAAMVARENGTPYLIRDVFLDNEHNPEYIRNQFRKLTEIAKRKGHALGIGHPHAATIEVLAEELQNVEKKYGVKFVSIQTLLLKQSDTPPIRNSEARLHGLIQNRKPLL